MCHYNKLNSTVVYKEKCNKADEIRETEVSLCRVLQVR